MRFDGVTTYECNDAHTRVVQLTDTTATIHHCFFDHVLTHSPRVDDASQVHLYDNLLADNRGYGVAAICGAEILMEGNTFERVVTPTTREACDDMTAPGKISAAGNSNHYRDVGEHKGGDNSGDEPNDKVFDPQYAYTLDGDEDAWLTVLTNAGAGGLWALPLSLD
jgi:pectate lyase